MSILRKLAGAAAGGAGGGGGTAWEPDQLTNLEAWYDADDATTITESSGAVSQWDDKSGNGYHLTQGTGAAQPTTGTRTLNSKNVMDFDGSDDLMAVAFGTALTQGNSFFGVFSIDDYLPTGVQYYWDGDDSTNRNAMFFNYGAGTFDIFGGSSVIGYGAVNQNDNIFSAVFNGASSFLSENGELSPTTSNPGAASIDGLTLASRYNGQDYLDGIIAEFIVVDEAVSESDRQKVEGYLAHKWGLEANLPAAHPYKSSAPTI